MSWSKITLIGFQNWLNDHGKDLFENLILPEGIEKDILCNNILLQGGEYEVLYSNPDMLVSQIGYWSRKNFRTFQKWIEALNIKYDPLFNYDRHEEWTDEGSGTRENETNTTANSSLSSSTTSDSDGSNTVENTRSAFDAATYQPLDKSESSYESTTETETENSSEDSSSGSLKEDTTNSSNHKGHMWGNIGVVSSQQMLQSELDIVSWNIYEHITDMFLIEFTIPVYE